MTSFLQCQLRPGRHVIPGVTMAEHACSIENGNVSEDNNPVDCLRVISKYYSVSHSLYYPCIRNPQPQVEYSFELE